MAVPLQVYAPQKQWRPQVISHLYATSNIVNILDSGVKGDGVDDTEAWNALLDAVPNGAIILVPDPSFVMRITDTLVMHKRGVKLVTQLDARNFAPSPSFLWDGANNGTMLAMDRCQACHVEGFTWNTTSGKTVNTAIDIDGYSIGDISTQNVIRYSAFNFSNQLNADAKIISISGTAANNNENMDIWDNIIIVSSANTPAAGGYGIYNGPSSNAKHHRFYRNSITQGTAGIYMANGSAEITHLGAGANETDIIVALATEPIIVTCLETENSKRGMDFRPQAGILIMDGCRFSNLAQTNSGGFVKIDGDVTLRGCNWEGPPPIGGTGIEDAGSGNCMLSMDDHTFSNGWTFAETGLGTFAALVGTATGGLQRLNARNIRGLADVPTFGPFEYGAINPVNGDPSNQFFGSPVRFNAFTFSQLTTAATPKPGTVAYITNSNTVTFGATIAAASPGSPVLAWFNGTNWTVVGA